MYKTYKYSFQSGLKTQLQLNYHLLPECVLYKGMLISVNSSKCKSEKWTRQKKLKNVDERVRTIRHDEFCFLIQLFLLHCLWFKPRSTNVRSIDLHLICLFSRVLTGANCLVSYISSTRLTFQRVDLHTWGPRDPSSLTWSHHLRHGECFCCLLNSKKQLLMRLTELIFLVPWLLIVKSKLLER